MQGLQALDQHRHPLGGGLGQQQHLLRLLHRALPAIHRDHRRQHAYAGGQPLLHQRGGQALGGVGVGAAAEDQVDRHGGSVAGVAAGGPKPDEWGRQNRGVSAIETRVGQDEGLE